MNIEYIILEYIEKYGLYNIGIKKLLEYSRCSNTITRQVLPQLINYLREKNDLYLLSPDTINKIRKVTDVKIDVPKNVADKPLPGCVYVPVMTNSKDFNILKFCIKSLDDISSPELTDIDDTFFRLIIRINDFLEKNYDFIITDPIYDLYLDITTYNGNRIKKASIREHSYELGIVLAYLSYILQYPISYRYTGTGKIDIDKLDILPVRFIEEKYTGICEEIYSIDSFICNHDYKADKIKKIVSVGELCNIIFKNRIKNVLDKSKKIDPIIYYFYGQASYNSCNMQVSNNYFTRFIESIKNKKKYLFEYIES